MIRIVDVQFERVDFEAIAQHLMPTSRTSGHTPQTQQGWAADDNLPTNDLEFTVDGPIMKIVGTKPREYNPPRKHQTREQAINLAIVDIRSQPGSFRGKVRSTRSRIGRQLRIAVGGNR